MATASLVRAIGFVLRSNGMKQFQVRDTRNGEWHWVYNAVIADSHLTPADKLIYSALATFSGYSEIYPSFKSIAERANLSERAAQSAIKKLEKIGYISKTTGGGRFRTNAYNLLKMPKGCKLCTVSKGCKLTQERVQTTTEKGANYSPNIDILNKKEIDNLAPHSGAGKEVNELIEIFKGVNPSYERFFGNKTERIATERLLAKYGREKLENIIRALPAIISKPFAPKITTPYILEKRLGELIAFVNQEKTRNGSSKIAVIS